MEMPISMGQIGNAYTIRRISYTLSEALNLLFSGKAKEA